MTPATIDPMLALEVVTNLLNCAFDLVVIAVIFVMGFGCGLWAMASDIRRHGYKVDYGGVTRPFSITHNDWTREKWLVSPYEHEEQQWRQTA